MVAARHIGLKDPRESALLRAACHWFGNPDQNIEIEGDDEPLADWRSPYHSELSTMSFVPFRVCARSGRGALFVPEMDRRHFSVSREVWQGERTPHYTNSLGAAAPEMSLIRHIGAGMVGSRRDPAAQQG